MLCPGVEPAVGCSDGVIAVTGACKKITQSHLLSLSLSFLTLSKEASLLLLSGAKTCSLLSKEEAEMVSALLEDG